MKQKQRRNKKKETKTRNKKKAKKRKTRRKEEKKERDRERESEKGGGQKKLRRNKGRQSKNSKNANFRGKIVFFTMKTNKRKEQEKGGQKTNKEGLGPSEVALWATSPDPYALQKNQNKKKNKPRNQTK